MGSIEYEPDSTPCAPRPPDRDGRRRGVEESSGNRGAFAVAERLGTEPVIFPGDHGGFFGGEYGQTGDPDAFAAKLRDVLAEG